MKFLVIVVLYFGFNSCTKKMSDAVNTQKPVLIFGNGGGFTGAFTTIHLYENGDVYKMASSDSALIKIGNIDARIAKQQFQNYVKLGLDKLELNEPGNRYYFITFVNNGVEHKIQWGAKELKNQNPAILHKIVTNLVKKLGENI